VGHDEGHVGRRDHTVVSAAERSGAWQEQTQEAAHPMALIHSPDLRKRRTATPDRSGRSRVQPRNGGVPMLKLALFLGATALLPQPAPRPQRFDFDDDEVQGTIVQPSEDRVDGRRPHDFPSLIRVRTTFVPELVKSADGH
jgi:hypothetical protein